MKQKLRNLPPKGEMTTSSPTGNDLVKKLSKEEQQAVDDFIEEMMDDSDAPEDLHAYPFGKQI